MQIKDLPASTSLANTDVLVKETSAGTTQKITGSNLLASIVKSESVSGATNAEGNLALSVTYTTGVPIAANITWLDGSTSRNAFAVFGRWATGSTGAWGMKVLKSSISGSGYPDVAANVTVSGTVYYLSL